MVAYHAVLTGLPPETTDKYEVVPEGRWSDRFAVSTAQAATHLVRVTAVGDHGIADPENPFHRHDHA